MKTLSLLRQVALCLMLGSVARAATHQVTVNDDFFQPENLTVAPGDTVVWTMIGGNSHTVTATDGSFDSGQPFVQGTTFSYTFTEEKRYPYQCAFHLSEMPGQIRVVDATNNVVPNTPVNSTPPNAATNLSVAPTLTASVFSDPNENDEPGASQWQVRNIATGEIVLDTVKTEKPFNTLTIADLEQATTYAWRVRYRDDVSLTAWSEYSTETEFTTVSAPTSDVFGLKVTFGGYVPAVKAVGKKPAKPEKFIPNPTPAIDGTVQFDAKLGKYRTAPANNFFVRWEGNVLPDFSERYRFRVRADGAVRLWINNVAVIDDYDFIRTPFAVYRSAVVPLQAGVAVSIKLEYYDTTGAASASLAWSSSSVPTEIIPTTKLFPPTP